MKRWRVLLAVLAVLLITATLVARRAMKERARTRDEAQKERTVAYEAIIAKYSADLKPGLTRKAVEDYLRAKGANFFQSCCYEEHGVFATLTKIGDEEKPWFCSAVIVYGVFEFLPSGPDTYPMRKALDADTLKRVHWTTRGEGCL